MEIINLQRLPERQIVADGTGQFVLAVPQGVDPMVDPSRRPSPDDDVAMSKAYAPGTVRA